jgi:hypothetical protein
MSDPSNLPFERDRLVDKPGIIGARWWHASLADQASLMVRRDAIRNILIAGGVIAGFGAMLAMCVKAGASSSSAPVTPGSLPLPDDMTADRKTALDMQKDYGWSFGAPGEPLVFDGVTTKPFEAGALHSLATDLSPSQKSLKPFFQAALFDSPDAVPRSLATMDPDEAVAFRPLAESVKPIFTPAMDAAYARGKSFASLFASLNETGLSASSAQAAVVVDLPGPEAVAFAAGAAMVFDPVFLFDNWPHPRGVVRAQETLSAAAYYQPLFSEAKSQAGGKRPAMFVLDRRRLAGYTDDATQFDNRYVAKLPTTASAMRAIGGEHVLYVVPTLAAANQELDDLNDDFVGYAAGGLDVKVLSLDMFAKDPKVVTALAVADSGAPTTLSKLDAGLDPRPPGADGKPVKLGADSDRLLAESGYLFYGGNRGSHHAFFLDYPWVKPARPALVRPATNPGKGYAPQARATSYSSGSPGSVSLRTKPRPSTFGTVPVVVALGTGVILGSRYSRSGSWNRSSGGWGGG